MHEDYDTENARLREALEKFWEARRALYEDGKPGITAAKTELYEVCSEVFYPIDKTALAVRGRSV